MPQGYVSEMSAERPQKAAPVPAAERSTLLALPWLVLEVHFLRGSIQAYPFTNSIFISAGETPSGQPARGRRYNHGSHPYYAMRNFLPEQPARCRATAQNGSGTRNSSKSG